MKIQDIAFIGVLFILFVFRKPRVFILTGLVCFLLAIPLFSRWVFFTGERLTWYGAAFITLGIIGMYCKKEKKV